MTAQTLRVAVWPVSPGRPYARREPVVVGVIAPGLGSSALGEPPGGRTIHAQRLLRAARELLSTREGTTIETRKTAADPAVVLVDAAREAGADLLIVGRRGGDFVHPDGARSVAQRVVQQAPCDALVVG